MINQTIDNLKGIGPKKYELLKKLNLQTIMDLYNNFPRKYINPGNKKKLINIKDKEQVTALIKVKDSKLYNNYGRKSILKVSIFDDTTSGEIIFFNSPYFKSKFKIGEYYYIFGTFNINYNGITINHPEFIHYKDSKKEDFFKIRPVYSLTEGFSNKEMIKLHKQLFKSSKYQMPENIPKVLIEKRKLKDINSALKEIHFPSSPAYYKAAKYRLIYNEIFFLTLGLKLLKHKSDYGKSCSFENKDLSSFIDSLPFDLTSAQLVAIDEITKDLASDNNTNRLLQGDVGSGKTVVAMVTMFFAYLNNYQSVLMVPTEILAKQHFKSFKKFFSQFNIVIEIITSSTSNKDLIKERIRSGDIDMVIGTHALLQDDVQFYNLGYTVIDEQHRFGVHQRLQLKAKGKNPGVLIMTATPIPRSLSLIMYGNVNVSVIDTMPNGRLPIKTHFVSKNKLDKMHDFIKKELDANHQAYFVCPLIEESEVIDAHAAEDLFYYFKNDIYKDYSVELVHGKMNKEEQEVVMQNYKEGKIDLLISTTVIEIGIDVPQSTVMVIMNAERFGLAQLHQLRGRVGRSSLQSYCFLHSENLGKNTKKRIDILVNSNDGFEISKKDLEIRGPGDLLGFKQHGIFEFKLADLSKHQDVLMLVQEDVNQIVEKSRLEQHLYEYIKKIEKILFDDFTI